MNFRLKGLIAATHSPFDSQGDLNLAIIDKQAAHLQHDGVNTVFVCGTTGESASMTVEERMMLAGRWAEVTRGSKVQLVVHIGSNCLADSRALAAHTQKIGAAAISMLAPSYFKPESVTTLMACCAQVASAAPQLPFYFYDIPSMTGVRLSMPDFLVAAKAQIPNLVGLKFTNPDLVTYLRLLQLEAGKFDVPWGTDECLLAALAVGGTSAIGSTYNFAAPLYHRLIGQFSRGDLSAARAEQLRSIELVQTLAACGFMAAAKALMSMLGVEVGPPRLPCGRLDDAQIKQLRSRLETLGFFEWGRR